MFEAMQQLTDMTDRLNSIRNVSARLLKKDPEGRAHDLASALQELQKTFDAIELVLIRYLSLRFTDQTRDEDEATLVELECGASQRGAAKLVGEMRAHCSKIGQLYWDSLRGWFASSGIDGNEGDELDALFDFISDSDTNVIIPATAELVDWLCAAISDTLRLAENGQHEQARDRVRAARRDVAPLRRKMGRVVSDLRDLELQFT